MTENKKIVVSPCISICQYDHEDTCIGCYRTKEERLKWKDQDSTHQWKEENLQAIKQECLKHIFNLGMRPTTKKSKDLES